MALMTASALRGEVLPELTSTGADTYISSLISRFDALAAAYCGFPAAPGSDVDAAQTLESAAYVLYLDGPDYGDPRNLRLGVRPVTAVTSIYDDPDEAYGSSTLVDSGDYTLLGERGVVRLKTTAAHGTWYRAPRSQKVTCTAGFATIPEAIKGALVIQVRHWFHGTKSVGVESISQEGLSKQLRDLTLLPSVRQMLRPFVLAGGLLG